MKCLSREMIIPFTNGRPVFPGFISYISNSENHLLHRSGWEDFSDGYDDFADSFSYDNGKTWTEPVLKLKKHETPEGDIRYAENACFLDPDTDRFFTFCSAGLYPKDHTDVDSVFSVVYDSYDVSTKQWAGQTTIPLELPGGVCISFCFPIKTKSGKIIIPALSNYCDDQGKPIHYKDCWAPANVSLAIIAEYDQQGDLQFSLGNPTPVDLEETSRGYSENAIAELADGRLVMILRGDNSMFPEKPGYKWVAYSEDEGMNWSKPVPLGCDVGEPIESSSTGSALFRSFTNDKLYWIGNLCGEGVRANGNWPRSPLVIAEVCEEPFALKRGTITTIDTQRDGEPDQVQHSNFRFYQDRETGEIVLLLSRYGQRSAEDWMNADHYRYVIQLD